MKKVLNWIIGAILMVYGVIMTIMTFRLYKEGKKVEEKLINEQNRGRKVRESLRKRYRERQCKKAEDYLDVTGDICKEMNSAKGDKFDDLCEEYWIGNLVYSAMNRSEIEWLRW